MARLIRYKHLLVGIFWIGSFFKLLGQSDSLLLENLLCSDSTGIIKRVISAPHKYRLQIVYSNVSLDKWNCLKTNQYTYRLRENEYFYPASLVKLPVALLALEWLDKNRLSPNLRLQTKASSICTFKPAINKDTTTVAQYIQKSLVVSDNRSFNELYELLGINYINATLQAKGYNSTQIFQRLDNCDYPTNLKNDTVLLTARTGDTLYFRGLENALRDYETRNSMIGTKFFLNGKYIDSGKNFKHCNQLSITDLHQMLLGIFYPESLPVSKQFCISDRDRQFLASCLSLLPNELDSLKYPKRSGSNVMDFKYILAGGSANGYPSNIKIFNKVGLSYGFMEDVAFVADSESKTGFFVSCVLFANEDGFMNDGKYEYTTIGFPFMKRLGQILLDHHKTNSANKAILPNIVNNSPGAR